MLSKEKPNCLLQIGINPCSIGKVCSNVLDKGVRGVDVDKRLDDGKTVDVDNRVEYGKADDVDIFVVAIWIVGVAVVVSVGVVVVVLVEVVVLEVVLVVVVLVEDGLTAVLDGFIIGK